MWRSNLTANNNFCKINNKDNSNNGIKQSVVIHMLRVSLPCASTHYILPYQHKKPTSISHQIQYLLWIDRDLSSLGVAWVTWPNFEILGPPYNFWTNGDICFKFGTDIEDWPLLCLDHKMTPKWAWLRVTWPKFGILGPLITFERIELSASNLAQT